MYTLYKNSEQYDTLFMVQYMYHCGISFLPNTIYETNFPSNIKVIPTIKYNNTLYEGSQQITALYEQISGISNLLNKAKQFKNNNPEYRIRT